LWFAGQDPETSTLNHVPQDYANKVLDKYDNKKRLEEIEKKEEKRIQEM